MSRTFPISLIFVALCVAGGCTQRQEQTHAQWEMGSPQKLKPALLGGLYEVKWSASANGPRFAVPASKRIVGEGDLIGFAPNEGGGVLAFAGRDQFEIHRLPAQARYWAWSTETVRESQVARNLRTTATIVGGTAFLGGLIFGEALLGGAIESLDAYSPEDRSTNRSGPRHPDKPTDTGNGSERGTVPWAYPPKVSEMNTNP